MVERIPRGMPIHTWVDRLIHEATERGEFDNLAGSGKPLAGIDKPVDEDWWVKQKIREEELPADALLPPALALRKEVRALPDTVRDMPDEASVRAAVAELNYRVAEWIRAPSGPVLPVGPASAEDVVAGWRRDRGATAEESVGRLEGSSPEEPPRMSDPQQSQPPRVDPATGRAPGVGRWHGLIWVVIAVLAPAVWIWPRTAGGELELLQQFWYVLGLLALGVAATVIQEFRSLQRGGKPVTNGLPLIAFVALTIVVTMVSLIWNPPLTPWFAALAVLPGIPCAIAGVRILIR